MPHSIPKAIGVTPLSGAAGGSFLVAVVLDQPGRLNELFDVTYVVAGGVPGDVFVGPPPQVSGVLGQTVFHFTLKSKKGVRKNTRVVVQVLHKTKSAFAAFYISP